MNNCSATHERVYQEVIVCQASISGAGALAYFAACALLRVEALWFFIDAVRRRVRR